MQIAMVVLLVLVVSGVLGHFFLPVRIRKEVVRSRKIKSPIGMVQISDIHFGFYTGRWVLRMIIGRLERTRPDIILLTGDSIDLGKKYLRLLDELLRYLAVRFPNVPKIAVPGNHHLEAPLEIQALYTRYGVTYLRNEWMSAAGIKIYGIRDLTHPETDGERADLDPNPHTWMPKEWPKDVYRILLSHVPGIVKESPTKGVGDKVRAFDLIVSGHTHGGLSPVIRWLVHEPLSRLFLRMPSEMAPRREVWGVTQIISRGLGAPAAFGLVRNGKVWISTAIPFVWRHYCREIVEITLEPEG